MITEIGYIFYHRMSRLALLFYKSTMMYVYICYMYIKSIFRMVGYLMVE